MSSSLDTGDYFIIAFIAIVFCGGIYAVYKFMRHKD